MAHLILDGVSYDVHNLVIRTVIVSFFQDFWTDTVDQFQDYSSLAQGQGRLVTLAYHIRTSWSNLVEHNKLPELGILSSGALLSKNHAMEV